MNDRLDETKGNIKQGVGKVTGNRRMQAEGKGEAEAAAARRHVKDTANQARDRVEEGLGKVTDDDASADRDGRGQR